MEVIVKVCHLFFLISWLGLFLATLTYIQHNLPLEVARRTYLRKELPSMLLATVLGLSLIIFHPEKLKNGFFHLKLTAGACLIGCNIWYAKDLIRLRMPRIQLIRAVILGLILTVLVSICIQKQVDSIRPNIVKLFLFFKEHMTTLTAFLDYLLLASCIIILTGNIILSFKTRFVQFRLFPHMLRAIASFFKKSNDQDLKHTIVAHKALFTAMSTTIGISTIVGPVIAMNLGGPGALLGFVLSTLFGCAANFAEVTFALSFRKKTASGTILGGPMQYLKDGISANLAKCYAFFGLLLMIAWSSAQANQLASILASPALQSISIPTVVTGIVVTLGTLYILVRGIKQIGDFSAKLVPAMFVIYVGAALWILALHIDLLPAAVALVFKSAFEPYTFASGAVVGGLAQALRWGVFKGVQSNEAGIGTQTIPHSMAENDIPADQGILSMVATYSAGFICILSGLVTLVTGTWQRPDLALGINMVAESFRMDFSYVGIVIVAISAFLFAFGTILGNSFNGSQCFGFLTNNKYSKIYFVITACGIFLGATSDVQVIWTMTDFFLAPLAVSHIAAIVYLSFTRKELLHTDQLKLEQPVATS